MIDWAKNWLGNRLSRVFYVLPTTADIWPPITDTPSAGGSSPLKPWDVPILFQELREQHARGEESLTPALVQRIVSNYIDLIDPAKLYLLNSEIDPWLHASPERLEEIGRSYQNWQFGAFETLDQLMAKAIARRAAWKPSDTKDLPEEKDRGVLGHQ